MNGVRGRVAAAAALWVGLAAGADDGPKPNGFKFGMTEPVVCKEINGYEDYVPLDPPGLTADEKLLLYFRPLHYKTAAVGGKHKAHLTQDGRIRRRGQKAVLWSKSDLLDYKVETDAPPRLIYLRNTVSLKGLKPGEYDFDVVLRDKVGQSEAAVTTVPFRVVAAPAPDAPADGSKKKDGPAGSKDRGGPP